MTHPEIPILTRYAYTYYVRHCHGRGWRLFDEASSWPTIQRIDETAAFADDAQAALHVVRAATFDAGLEGHACREALRTIIRFGEQGLNPIATMLSRGGHR
jgi:hypothetical protein